MNKVIRLVLLLGALNNNLVNASGYKGEVCYLNNQDCDGSCRLTCNDRNYVSDYGSPSKGYCADSNDSCWTIGTFEGKSIVDYKPKFIRNLSSLTQQVQQSGMPNFGSLAAEIPQYACENFSHYLKDNMLIFYKNGATYPSKEYPSSPPTGSYPTYGYYIDCNK